MWHMKVPEQSIEIQTTVLMWHLEVPEYAYSIGDLSQGAPFVRHTDLFYVLFYCIQVHDFGQFFGSSFEQVSSLLLVS